MNPRKYCDGPLGGLLRNYPAAVFAARISGE